VLYKEENQNVSSTGPILLNEAYSICWSGAETEMHVFKTAANFREKRTSSTTMGAKTLAFASFPAPVSHYPLPLSYCLGLEREEL
jgi:hypothetical protein